MSDIVSIRSISGKATLIYHLEAFSKHRPPIYHYCSSCKQSNLTHTYALSGAFRYGKTEVKERCCSFFSILYTNTHNHRFLLGCFSFFPRFYYSYTIYYNYHSITRIHKAKRTHTLTHENNAYICCFWGEQKKKIIQEIEKYIVFFCFPRTSLNCDQVNNRNVFYFLLSKWMNVVNFRYYLFHWKFSREKYKILWNFH